MSTPEEVAGALHALERLVVHTAMEDAAVALECEAIIKPLLERLRATPCAPGGDGDAWRPISEAPTAPYSKIIGWCLFGIGRAEGEARFCHRDHAGVWMGHGCQQKVTHFKPWPTEAPATPSEGG